MLWIRSQREYGIYTRLCLAQNLYIETDVDMFFIKNNKDTIARYNTSEQALEVFNEIQNEIVKNSTMSWVEVSKDKHRLQNICCDKDIVYEMPENRGE